MNNFISALVFNVWDKNKFTGEVIEVPKDLDDDLFNGVHNANLGHYFTIAPLPNDFDETKHTAHYQVDTQEWVLQNLKLSGEFYEKATGKKFEEIDAKDISLYTNITPLQNYNDGTKQAFNDDLEAWEYTFKGEELLAYEAKIELESAKNQKINELEAAYEKSKKIKFVQAKIEEMNILDRDHFFDMISSLRRGENELIGEGDLVIKRHINHQERKELVAIVYFQRLVFYDKFVHTYAGMPISIREDNYCKYLKLKAAIEQCQTQDNLDLIAFNFLNPDGVLIDVQAEAESILKSPETPDVIKQKIEERRGKDGFIRLFYSY